MAANLACFALWHENERVDFKQVPSDCISVSAHTGAAACTLQYLTPRAGLVSAPDFWPLRPRLCHPWPHPSAAIQRRMQIKLSARQDVTAG